VAQSHPYNFIFYFFKKKKPKNFFLKKLYIWQPRQR
jgi:hypothetical protein